LEQIYGNISFIRKTLLIFKSVNEALANPTVNRWEFEYQFTMIKEIVHIIDRGLIIRDVVVQDPNGWCHD
jgi:hypothetical protein